MSIDDKPAPLKPVLWDKDSGEVTPADQTDWRIEGTVANRRVKELQAKAGFWSAVTGALVALIVFLIIALAYMATLEQRNWVFGWGLNASIVVLILGWFSCAKLVGYEYALKVWTEDR